MFRLLMLINALPPFVLGSVVLNTIIITIITIVIFSLILITFLPGVVGRLYCRTVGVSDVSDARSNESNSNILTIEYFPE